MYLTIKHLYDPLIASYEDLIFGVTFIFCKFHSCYGSPSFLCGEPELELVLEVTIPTGLTTKNVWDMFIEKNLIFSLFQ